MLGNPDTDPPRAVATPARALGSGAAPSGRSKTKFATKDGAYCQNGIIFILSKSIPDTHFVPCRFDMTTGADCWPDDTWIEGFGSSDTVWKVAKGHHGELFHPILHRQERQAKQVVSKKEAAAARLVDLQQRSTGLDHKGGWKYLPVPGRYGFSNTRGAKGTAS